jgi:hypothetical protein
MLLVAGAVALAVVLAAVAATFLIEYAHEQDERLEARSALVGDMSASLADAIGIAQLGARGDVREPTHRRALSDWTVARERIGAELGGRFPGEEIVRTWRAYGRAVGDYIRLGAVAVDRDALLGFLSAYAREAGVVWGHLAPPSGIVSGPEFQVAYEHLGAWLLRRGGELVRQVLSLEPDV